MCGLAGILSADGTDGTTCLTEMGRLLRHRGPDDVGYLAWDGTRAPAVVGRRPPEGLACRIGLVHRRLSVLDLTDAGWQPMTTRSDRLALVYNGELYNHVELAADLRRRGHDFRSHCDTEVVLAAYAEHGPEAFALFQGMFALALLDLDRRELVLARDQFGIKPMFYSVSEQGLSFASEIKALLKSPDVSTEAAPQALYRYLRFGMTDHSEQTLFRDIKRLPPATYACVPLDGPFRVVPRQYWSLPAQRRASMSRPEAVTAVREAFRHSVAFHMRSDVPVGAALSGGIDSSAIVAVMREVGGAGLDLRTFSYLPAQGPNEEFWVRAVVEAVGATAHTVDFRAQELVDDLDSVIRAHDEPFGSTSMYAQYRVFRAARESGVTVMLDGQGADELFAGYRPHLIARCASLLSRGRLVDAVALARRISGLPGASGALRVLAQASAGLAPEVVLAAARRVRSEELMPDYLDASWFASRGVSAARVTPRHGLETLSDVLHDGVRHTLADLLRYEDRNSMAHSVESRVPFLTTSLAELAFSLPEDHLVDRRAVSKSIFREAMDGIVPDVVLQRRDKVGFATPESELLRALDPWVQTTLASLGSSSVPALRADAVRARWQEVSSGRRRLDQSVWRWLNVIRWTELYDVTYDA